MPKKHREELERVIINPADASQDQFMPNWALNKFIVSGHIVRDTTNNKWCSATGDRLPYKKT